MKTCTLWYATIYVKTPVRRYFEGIRFDRLFALPQPCGKERAIELISEYVSIYYDELNFQATVSSVVPKDDYRPIPIEIPPDPKPKG